MDSLSWSTHDADGRDKGVPIQGRSPSTVHIGTSLVSTSARNQSGRKDPGTRSAAARAPRCDVRVRGSIWLYTDVHASYSIATSALSLSVIPVTAIRSRSRRAGQQRRGRGVWGEKPGVEARGEESVDEMKHSS